MLQRCFTGRSFNQHTLGKEGGGTPAQGICGGAAAKFQPGETLARHDSGDLNCTTTTRLQAALLDSNGETAPLHVGDEQQHFKAARSRCPSSAKLPLGASFSPPPDFSNSNGLYSNLFGKTRLRQFSDAGRKQQSSKGKGVATTLRFG